MALPAIRPTRMHAILRNIARLLCHWRVESTLAVYVISIQAEFLVGRILVLSTDVEHA
jgi:hypothetical protein